MNTPIKDSLIGIKSVLIFFGIVAITIVLILAQKNIIHIFLLYSASVIIAILFDEFTSLIGKLLPVPRLINLLIVVLLILGVLLLCILILGPILAKEANILVKSLPQAIKGIQAILDSKPWGKEITSLIKPESFVPFGMNLINSVETVFAKSFSFASEFIFVLLVAAFLAVNPRLYIDNLVLLFRPSRRTQIKSLLYAVNTAIRKWFFGRFCAMVLIGLLTFISYKLVEMPLSFVLGFIAGLLTMIPFLGAILSIIPALLVALSTYPILAIWVAPITIGAHIAEDIIAPVIQQKMTSVPPALLVSAQIFLVFVGGILGLLLAEPLCLIAIIAVQIVYVKDILGEDVVILGEKRNRKQQQT